MIAFICRGSQLTRVGPLDGDSDFPAVFVVEYGGSELDLRKSQTYTGGGAEDVGQRLGVILGVVASEVLAFITT